MIEYKKFLDDEVKTYTELIRDTNNTNKLDEYREKSKKCAILLTTLNKYIKLAEEAIQLKQTKVEQNNAAKAERKKLAEQELKNIINIAPIFGEKNDPKVIKSQEKLKAQEQKAQEEQKRVAQKAEEERLAQKAEEERLAQEEQKRVAQNQAEKTRNQEQKAAEEQQRLAQEEQAASEIKVNKITKEEKDKISSLVNSNDRNAIRKKLLSTTFVKDATQYIENTCNGLNSDLCIPLRKLILPYMPLFRRYIELSKLKGGYRKRQTKRQKKRQKMQTKRIKK